MQREIIFRAKKKYSNEWVFGYIVKSNQFDGWFIDFHKDGKDHSEEVKPETIGQFTGLVDKNSNKIFEGDVLLIMGGLKYNVVFKSFGWMVTNGIVYYDFNQIKSSSTEIIGNIHEL